MGKAEVNTASIMLPFVEPDLRPFLLLLLTAVIAAGCAPASGGPGTDPDSAQELSPAWSVDIEASPDMRVVPVTGGILIASRPSTLLRLDVRDGSLLWITALEDPIEGAPSVLETDEGEPDLAAVALEDGDVALLSLEDGSLVRRWPLGWEAPRLSSVKGRLLAHSADGRIALFDTGTGRALWQAHLQPLARVGAVHCDEWILVGTTDGQLIAMDPMSGRVAWRESLPSAVAAEPVCDGRDLLLVTEGNELHSLRLRRRSAGIQWTARTGADPVGPPLVREETILLISKDTYAYGFRRGNGHLVFRTRLARRPGPPAVLGRLILVAGPHVTRLDAFHLPEGRSAGAFELPEGTRFLTPPVVSGSRVLLGVARYGEEQSRIIALEVKPGG